MRTAGWKLAGIAALVAVLAGSAAAYHRSLREQRFLARLEDAKSLLQAQRVDEARRLLRELTEQRPDDPQAAYYAGICEYARGNLNAAAASWTKVGLDTPVGGLARYYRARIAIPRGRFTEAEELLNSSLTRPGPHVDDARWELVKLLRLEGRFEEARRLFLQGMLPDADLPSMLKLLYSLDVNPVPLESLRTSLDAALRQSPQDDRVWLARGHLALAQGDLADADRWLKACEQKRPGDAAVARLRLAWALAAGKPESARAALAQVPVQADDLELEWDLTRLAAWFARQDGDRESERRSLEQLLAARPRDAVTLDRLAELAALDDRRDEVAAYRRRKEETDPIRKRYETLLGAPEWRANAEELEALASQLGREVDVRCWRFLRRLERGEEAALGLQADARTSTGEGPPVMMADLLASRSPGHAADREIAGQDQARSRKADTPADSLSLPRFQDDAESAGLVFIHRNGDVQKRLIPPVTGSGGVALLDYDGDGWLDVFAVQSGAFPFDPKSPHEGDRLFRNRGDGSWEDVTDSSGLAAMRRGYGHGVTVGDHDNDGHPDLFVTRWRSYSLYRNRGDGTFEDRTDSAGLGGDRDWPTSAAFADLDNDGDLDLYVCHYMRWEESDPRPCSDPANPEVYHCSPLNFPALPDHVFRNDGGRFVDVTEHAGIHDLDGRGLGVVAADVNEDGRVDLFVANDMTANYLFLNRGGFQFEEVGQLAGVAGNASGGFQAGMGVGCGDLNGDGRFDLVVTNFYNEGTTYFENLGRELFADRSEILGIRGPSRYLLGFGVGLLDANNDGRLDLMSVNGHVNDGRPSYPWKMPVQLLMGVEGRPMRDVSRRAGEPFLVDRLGRGLAMGDLDNDGRIDALVQSQNDPLAYFHNLTADCGQAIRIRLEGRESNRDGVGARVRLSAGGRHWVAQRTGGGSYQSAGDPRIHVGLGTAREVDELEITWPSGRRERHTRLAAGHEYRIREGGGIVSSAAFSRGPR